MELDIDLPQQQLAALFAEISAVPVLPNGGGLRARITDQPNSDWTALFPLYQKRGPKRTGRPVPSWISGECASSPALKFFAVVLNIVFRR